MVSRASSGPGRMTFTEGTTGRMEQWGGGLRRSNTSNNTAAGRMDGNFRQRSNTSVRYTGLGAAHGVEAHVVVLGGVLRADSGFLGHIGGTARVAPPYAIISLSKLIARQYLPETASDWIQSKMMSLLSGKNGLFNPTHQASKGPEYPCSFFFARTMHGSLQNLEFPIIATQAFQLP